MVANLSIWAWLRGYQFALYLGVFNGVSAFGPCTMYRWPVCKRKCRTCLVRMCGESGILRLTSTQLGLLAKKPEAIHYIFNHFQVSDFVLRIVSLESGTLKTCLLVNFSLVKSSSAKRTLWVFLDSTLFDHPHQAAKSGCGSVFKDPTDYSTGIFLLFLSWCHLVSCYFYHCLSYL